MLRFMKTKAKKKLSPAHQKVIDDPKRREAVSKALQGNKFAVGNQGGRPEKWTQERLSQLAKDVREWIKLKDSIFMKTFLYEQDIHPNQIEELKQKSKEFSEAWDAAKVWQEQKLIVEALKRRTSEGITKFVLANVHGYKEKTEVSGDSSCPLNFILNDIDGKTKDIVKG